MLDDGDRGDLLAPADDAAPATSATSDPANGGASTDAGQEEPDPDPVVTSDDPVVTSDPPSPLERVVFDGVTFEYPPSLVDGVVPGRGADGADPVDAVDEAPPETPPAVTFLFEADGIDTARLTVVPVRDRDGVDHPGVDDAVAGVDALRAVLGTEPPLELEPGDVARLPFPDAVGETGRTDVVRFVNGVGVRTVGPAPAGEDTVYAFVGVTDDDRFLVRLTYGARGVDAVLADLDRLVASVFVDGASDAFASAASACEDDAQIVEDVTVPPGSEIGVGEEFVKTWRIRNTGTCSWDDSYSWAFAGGDAVTILETDTVARTGPGDDLDLDVRLRAPDEAGSVAAQWQLFSPDGLAGVGPPAVLLFEAA